MFCKQSRKALHHSFFAAELAVFVVDHADFHEYFATVLLFASADDQIKESRFLSAFFNYIIHFSAHLSAESMT